MKILFLLRSDCGNLPLSIVYNQLIAHKHEVDVVSLSDAENDLFMFDNPQKVFKWNEFFEKENLSFYDCIIASRNCFFTLQANVNKLLLDYRGVIITEHTTLYEGDNIYGDYVLTSGLYNYDRIPSNIDVPGFSVGNIKNLSNSSKAYKNIFADKDYVLFVESGHYPYGEKGRNQIARWIIEFCNIYPNLFLVVKPRYLEENCNDVTHRNSDHIYKYIYRMCNNVLPKNLILLHKHTILAELLQYTDTIVHTYSSAFAEAASTNKKIINLTDVFSEESLDIRSQRFAQIKKYIDKAKCNVSIESQPNINSAKRCEPDYVRYLFSHNPDENEVVQYIEQIVTSFQNERIHPAALYFSYNKNECVSLSLEKIRLNRMKGIVKNHLNFFAARFDDFISFNKIYEIISRKITVDLSYNELIAVVDKHIKNYVIDNLQILIQNKYNRAVVIEFLYNDGLLKDEGYYDLFSVFKDEAFNLFFGLQFYNNKRLDKARELLENYYRVACVKAYDETCADTKKYQETAREILLKIGDGLCAH